MIKLFKILPGTDTCNFVLHLNRLEIIPQIENFNSLTYTAG